MSNRIGFIRGLFFGLLSAALFVPAMALASDVHALFNVNSTTQAPFPSDRFTVPDFRQNTHLRVNMPFPNCTTTPSDCLDIALLNQLDGFNTQPRLSVPFDGKIDPNTFNSSTVFLVRLGSLFDPDDGLHPVIGINQVVWDPASLTAFAESDQHLAQHSSYLLVVTNGVTDPAGDPVEPSRAFLLERSLIDDLLRHLNLRPKHIVAASVFTTGSVTSTLEKIQHSIEAAPAPPVNFNLGIHGERTVFSVSSVIAILYGQQIDTVGPLNTVPVPTPALQVFPGSIGNIAFGKFTALNFETAGGFIPAAPTLTGNSAVQSTEDLFFNLFIPAGTPPNGGWPVAIFGHGFGDNKNDSPFAVASTLAHNGIATIAINAQGHGFGAGGTLTVIQGSGSTILPAGGRGVDQNGDGTIDSTEGLSATGAQSDIGTRDGLQQTVADLMQVVRAIQGGVDADNDGTPDLNPNLIYYFGQSLGGI